VNEEDVVLYDKFVIAEGGVMSAVVVRERGEEEDVRLPFTAVTTTVYVVPPVNTENVANFEPTPSSAEGVAAAPFNV
jgi:hypothetical protein